MGLFIPVSWPWDFVVFNGFKLPIKNQRETVHIAHHDPAFFNASIDKNQTLFIRREGRNAFQYRGISLWLLRVLLCCKPRFSMTSRDPKRWKRCLYAKNIPKEPKKNICSKAWSNPKGVTLRKKTKTDISFEIPSFLTWCFAAFSGCVVALDWDVEVKMWPVALPPPARARRGPKKKCIRRSMIQNLQKKGRSIFWVFLRWIFLDFLDCIEVAS